MRLTSHYTSGAEANRPERNSEDDRQRDSSQDAATDDGGTFEQHFVSRLLCFLRVVNDLPCAAVSFDPGGTRMGDKTNSTFAAVLA